MLEFYETLQEKDINLGKMNVEQLSAIQLNSLLNLNTIFSNYDCFIYIDNDKNIIVTSDYRDQDVIRDTKFRNGWITKHIDLVFGEINDIKENE